MIFIESVLLFLVDIIQSVSINSISRLICNGCIPETSKCCIGTAVSPKHFLTTYYCAETCQFVKRGKEEVPIKKIHVNLYPKTFVISANFAGPNTVALVEVEYDKNKNDSFVNLGVDKHSPSPLFRAKAFIPIFDQLSYKFKATTIKQCDKNTEYSNGYYVCAADEIYEDCEIPQGTPLFFEEQLLGIAGITNSLTCEYNNRIFISLEPTIYWINYILDDDLQFNMRRTLDKPGKKKYSNMKKSTKGIDKKKKNIIFNSSKSNQSKTKHINTSGSKNNFGYRNMTTIKKKEKTNKVITKLSIAKLHQRKITKKKTYKQNFNTINLKSRNMEKKDSAIKHKTIRIKKRERCSRPETKTSLIRTTKHSKYVKLTAKFIKRSTVKTAHPKTSKRQLISTNKLMITSKKLKFTKNATRGTKITNVMDWFLQIRNKTKNDRPQILVLTTSKVALPEFVDLT